MDEFDFEVVEVVDDVDFLMVLILIGISQSPSPDALRLPSRIFYILCMHVIFSLLVKPYSRHCKVNPMKLSVKEVP